MPRNRNRAQTIAAFGRVGYEGAMKPAMIVLAYALLAMVGIDSGTGCHSDSPWGPDEIDCASYRR